MNYYSNNNQLTAIHIDKNFSEAKFLFEEELTRKLNLREDLAILSDCTDSSILYDQCKNNNISIFKLDYSKIVDTLNSITSKYVLLVRGDAVLLGDFENVSSDFVMAGQEVPNSKLYPINYHKELLVPGRNKYFNSNMIFARRTKLIEFFENYKEFCMKNLKIDFSSAKPEVELALFSLWFSTTNDYMIDSQEKYFSSLNNRNCRIVEDEGNRYLKLINYSEINYLLF